jgi:hypothetical protein
MLKRETREPALKAIEISSDHAMRGDSKKSLGVISDRPTKINLDQLRDLCLAAQNVRKPHPHPLRKCFGVLALRGQHPGGSGR